MTDVSRADVRQSPESSGPRHKLRPRARRAPGWRAKPAVSSSPIRFQAVPFTDSTPTRLPAATPTLGPSAACQSPGENTGHHDNSQSGSSLIPQASQAVRSLMTGAMQLTGLVRETMVKVTHAASATTSVVTRTCCADTTMTESSHQTYSIARQTESYQMAIPTDDNVDTGQRPQRDIAPFLQKAKALPVRKVAPLPRNSDQEASPEVPSCEMQDSPPEQEEEEQTYTVAQLRKLFGDKCSVSESERSLDFSNSYASPALNKDLGSINVVKAEDAEEVGAQPYESNSSFKKGRKLCLMAIPAEPIEEENAGALPDGATNSSLPPSLTETMESQVVKDVLREGYSLELVQHAVWRRLHAGGGVSRPELLQAVKDLEQEYTAAEKKLGDKGFLKEQKEMHLALAMEEPVVKSVLSQGHDLESVRHVVWRRLQEEKGPFKSAPELLQAVADLKREYKQAGKKLDKTEKTEKTVDEKAVQYKETGGRKVDSTKSRANSVSVADAMASLVVQDVLRAGYSHDIVQHAVWRRLETNGKNFASVAELLQAIKDLEDEYARAKAKLGNDELPNNPSAVVMATAAQPESNNTTDDTLPSPTADNGTAQTPNKVTADANVESELERYREEQTCKVCFDARIEVVFVPCGHYACCGHCADGMAECPMCRRGVDSTVKVFFS